MAAQLLLRPDDLVVAGLDRHRGPIVGVELRRAIDAQVGATGRRLDQSPVGCRDGAVVPEDQAGGLRRNLASAWRLVAGGDEQHVARSDHASSMPRRTAGRAAVGPTTWPPECSRRGTARARSAPRRPRPARRGTPQLRDRGRRRHGQTVVEVLAGDRPSLPFFVTDGAGDEVEAISAFSRTWRCAT
jgi:hypothetical protein